MLMVDGQFPQAWLGTRRGKEAAILGQFPQAWLGTRRGKEAAILGWCCPSLVGADENCEDEIVAGSGS